MGQFNHFFLTKFNVRSFPELRPGCDPAWLENRFRLFDQFCYPSVRNQTNQNFKWLVFFDADTPEAFKNKISTYASEWQNFVPLYLDFPLPYGQFPDQARDVVRTVVTDECEYLITTWLDNDDAIAKNYVQMVQDNFNQQECETINFMFGYQLCNGKAYFDFEVASHFISLIERYNPDSFKTCLCRPHKELYEVCQSAKKILCRPAWVEVVHDSNYMNVHRRGFRVPAGKILDAFSIKAGTQCEKESKFPFLLDQVNTLLFFPYYFFRRVILRIKYYQFNELNISRFQLKNY